MRAPEQLDTKAVATALSAWFAKHARDLPWRRTRDPYAIWVSEIMLQQTRVDTVERYWSRFLDRFPSVEALAAADEEAVLEAWSGLGYYRRARLLHRGARHVHAEHGGALPETPAEIRAIPGVGRYTTGAIASIAFDQPVPLVDGNVARVHARLQAIEDPVEQDAKAEDHWHFVSEVLAHGSPRVLAQALMELGATVCTPRSPSCSSCPLRAQCRAQALGRAHEIPAVKTKKPSPEHGYYALALRWGERLLLERRPEGSLLAGMWCLPLFERPLDERDPEKLAAAASETLGVPMTLTDKPAGKVKHVFTHRVWHLLPWPARARRAPRLRKRDDARELAWMQADQTPAGGIPTLTRKLLAKL
nr:A/G-specific adenine glycosylase [Pseudenhygromyxa sp. WMMC2535]